MLLSGDVVDGNPDTSNDGDNVSDVVEGLGPNNGDGNLDGVADADQINVTSLPVLGATGGNDYVTIATPAGTTLTDVYTLDPTNPAQVAVPPPANVTLPEGLTRFIVEGLTPGASTTISIYTATTNGITGYAKYNETTHVWTTLPSGNVVISTGRIDLTLTDGGVGDDDGVANGRIVDPGGPAIIVGQPPMITVKGVADGATYILGKAPKPSCKATDATSGKKVTCAGVLTGGQSNGIGDFTYTATATGSAGATATSVVHFRVIYKFDGFLDPVHKDGRTFKVGDTIKVQFRLRNASGHHATVVTSPQWLTPVPLGSTVPTGFGSVTPIKRDGSTWIINWNTKGMAPGRYRIRVTLDDGTEHIVEVVLTRKN